MIMFALILAATVSSNPYGICMGAAGRSRAGVTQAVETCAKVGIGSIRWAYHTSQANARGGWDFTEVRERLAAFDGSGVEWLAQVKYPKGKGVRPHWPPHRPENLPYWNEFLARFVSANGKRVRNYEIWNEQNIGSFWPNPNPDDYFALLKSSYETLKREDPSCTVSIGGFAGLPLPFIERIYELGAARYSDAISFHFYAEHNVTCIPERNVDVRLDELRELMGRYGAGEQPIWVTETGLPVHEDAESTERAFRWVEHSLAQCVEAAFPGRRDVRVRVVSVEGDSGEIAPNTVRLVASSIPGAAETKGVLPEDVPDVVDGGKAEVIVWTLSEGYFDVDEDALDRFIDRGGLVIICGRHPLAERYVRDEAGAWKLVRERHNGADALKRYRVGTERLADGDSNPALRCGLNGALLGKGDRFEPIVYRTGRKTGRSYAVAGLYRYAGRRGAVAVITGINRFWAASTEERQAVRLARTYGILLAGGVDRVYWYCLTNEGKDPHNPQDHFGLLHPDFRPRPAARAYAQFIRARPAGSVRCAGAWHDESRAHYNPTWTCPDGSKAGMFWTIGRPFEEDFDVGGEVEFADVYGRPVTFPRLKRGGYRVRRTDSPIYWRLPVAESVTGFGPPGNPADMFRNIANIGPLFEDFLVHEQMADLGFNTYSGLAGLNGDWNYRTNGPIVKLEGRMAECRNFLDRIAQDGFCVINTFKNPHDKGFVELYPRRCKDGSSNPKSLDASDPNALGRATRYAEWVGRRLSHPAIVGIEPANEVRFRSHLSFTPERIAAWRAHSGRDVPPEVMALDDPTVRMPPHWRTLRDFPADHVVPDDYPVLDFYRWCWREGDGWTRYCKEVADAFRRGVGHDVRGMYSPSLRTPALWNVLGDMSIVRNWDYPNPEPYHLASMVAQLQSVARESGRTVIASVQSISYRRNLAPIGIHPENEPAWAREYPNCLYPTTPPDLLREAFWAVLSRRVDGVATHGYDALLDISRLRKVPEDYKLQAKCYRCTNPETARVLKDLFHSVVIPLGPLLRAIPEREPQVAVLASSASQILGSRITWDCKGRFYDAGTLAFAANLTPYVINEDEVKARGIPPSVRVLLMADCDVLTKTAYERIAAFQSGGGLLVADANLLPALKADAELPTVERAYAETASDHDDGKLTTAADPRKRDAALKRAAAVLKGIVGGKTDLHADTDSGDILVSVRSYGDADYVFPINDRRRSGDYVGPWKRVLEKGVPHAGRVTVNRAAGAVYDLVRRKSIPFESANGKTVIPVSFGTSEGKVLMVVSRPLAPLSFEVDGPRVTVRTPDRDVLIPIRIDGFGEKPFYGVVRDGAWAHDFGREPTGAVSVSNLANANDERCNEQA